MEMVKRERFPYSARKVWSIVRKFRRGGFQYALGTVISRETKDGEKFRTLAAVDGTKTVQRLVERNEDHMILKIEAVETTLPLTSWHSELQVTGDENEAEIEYKTRFEPEGISPEAASALMEDAWKIGLASFKKALQSQ